MSLGTFGVLAALVGGSWLAWKQAARPLSVGLAAVAVLPVVTIAKQVTLPMILAAAGLVGLVVWHRVARTSATVNRWGARSRRKSGVASSVDILRKASAWTMRKQARTVRPSLGEMSRWKRRRLPTTEVASLLCRVGPQRVWSSVENVVLVFGGPRMGKSGWLAGRIIDAPGAVLVTSTRTDLCELTAKLRQQRGPVFIFNAVGLGGVASTITFDPLTGCTDSVTAAERATDMIAASSHAGGGGAGDRAYWDGQARRVLAALLHAAALGGLTMRDVAGWVSDPEQGEAELMSMLKLSTESGYVADATQFVTTNDRTRTSITSTIMPALGWLTHPAASAAASGERPFDVAWLLENKATVYLLGGEETQAAPLVCALTGHIAREARRIAARKPGGRLDPPLTLALDEAALISPVPLASWTADMGGRGVSIIAAFQSRAQLIDRYGEAKAATIVTNAAAKVLFGGTSDRDDLTFWSTLAGNRHERVKTTDLHGRVASQTSREVPVLAPSQLAGLPVGKVVVFAKGMSPVVGRAQMAWRRPEVRAVLQPDSVRVRARAFAVRMPALVGSWLAWPVRALAPLGARGWQRAGAWIEVRAARARAGLALFIAGCGDLVSRRSEHQATPAETATSVPVVPFPTTPWDPSTPEAQVPSGLSLVDWSTETPNGWGKGHDEPGVWN